MKFGFILSKDYQLIEVTRIGHPSFDLILKITGISPVYLNLIEISIKKHEITNEINFLIEKRKLSSPDIPNYKGRFDENEIFEIRNYNGKELKLCTTGFDNQLIFLLNILEVIKKSNYKLYFLFAKNYKELREFQNKYSSNSPH